MTLAEWFALAAGYVAVGAVVMAILSWANDWSLYDPEPPWYREPLGWATALMWPFIVLLLFASGLAAGLEDLQDWGHDLHDWYRERRGERADEH